MALLPSIKIKRLDHHGLVAGMCKELGIAKLIDAVAPKSQKHHLSHGQAFVAMILNGLGFHSRTLHMCPDFFANKPLERLLGPGIRAEHINDDALGRCLDALYELGVSPLYQVLAQKTVEHLGLSIKALHVDITSFHVDGEYAVEDDDETKRIQLVQGYSRDHRPELNQVILELICESQAGIPVHMQALSGNTNDQSAFHEVVRAQLSSLKAAQECHYFVGDAALYTADSILALQRQEQLFISRVPMKLRESKSLVRQLETANLSPMGNGYHGHWVDEVYGGVKQKWLVIRSEQAYKREIRTLEKNLFKSTDKSLKQFNCLCNQRFACEADAMDAFAKFAKRQTYLEVHNPDCKAVPVYTGKGRPKKGQEPERYEYQLTGTVMTSLEKIALAKQKTGVFILATNDCSGELEMSEMLAIYKSQQAVERGFRFLKSPDFLTSSLFLKKPERIEALLMVMTCSLMIYAALEYRIRHELKIQDKYFPDVKKKSTQRPTARWVFLCFEGIYEVVMRDVQASIISTQERQWTILNCLGQIYQDIYS